MSGVDVAADEYFYRVLATIYRYARDVAVIDYPRSPSKRSIDIVASLAYHERKVLVKSTPDAATVSKREAYELGRLASVLEAAALIVSEYLGGVKLESGVVYERYGVNLVNLETLEESLAGRQFPYVVAHKDIFKVRIKGDELRRRRLERGFSLGDVASMLGVSRKSVYEYEKGVIEPTVERAERLIRIFGEDILEPIDIFEPVKGGREPPPEDFDVPEEGVIARELSRLGFTVAHAKRTSVDLGARGGRVRLLIVTRRRRESSQSMAERVAKSAKFSEVVKSQFLLVVGDKREADRLKAGDVEPLTLREAVERLRTLKSS
jgi:putative transcriptional regulator